MKNNRGFVVSAVLYPLLVLFLALIMGLISMSSTRKNILDNMKMEISDSIFDSVTCDCEVINSTLKKYGQSIKNIENDITAIENDINTINTTQNTLSTNLTNLTNRVTSLETNVNSLKSRMSTAESKITNIETNYATKTTTNLLDTKITNLTTTVNSINTSLTNLTNRVNTLAQQELNIYMSPNGNDSNDGLTSSKPMKTLNAVLNKYSNPNLVLNLAAGTYDWEQAMIANRKVIIKPSSLTISYEDASTPLGTTCAGSGSSTVYKDCIIFINSKGMHLQNARLELYDISLKFIEEIWIDVWYGSHVGGIVAYSSDITMRRVHMTADFYYPLIRLINSYAYAGHVTFVNKSQLILCQDNSVFKADVGSYYGTYDSKDKDSALLIAYSGSIINAATDFYAASKNSFIAYNSGGTISLTWLNKTGKTSGTVSLTKFG